MRPVERAVWYIESHLGTAMSLHDIARASGLSKFALMRKFRAATGRTVLEYARARRLSEAAKLLRAGTPRIMDVALTAGYGSHEAFSRAFSGHLGISPDEVRCGHRFPPLTEAVDMNRDHASPRLSPRLGDLLAFRLAGLSRRFSMENASGIPGLWQSFAPHIGSIPGEVADVTYGACYNTEGSAFDYLCGVEVRSAGDLPRGFVVLDVPASRYAIFHHAGHVTDIHALMRAIFGDWLPRSGCEAAASPVLERYGKEFDPRTGAGGFDVCVPLRS